MGEEYSINFVHKADIAVAILMNNQFRVVVKNSLKSILPQTVAPFLSHFYGLERRGISHRSTIRNFRGVQKCAQISVFEGCISSCLSANLAAAGACSGAGVAH